MNTEVIFDYITVPTTQTSDCIAINFFRPTASSNPAFVNGQLIEAGASFYVEQNVGDIDRTQYQITFTGADTTLNKLYVNRTVVKR